MNGGTDEQEINVFYEKSQPKTKEAGVNLKRRF